MWAVESGRKSLAEIQRSTQWLQSCLLKREGGFDGEEPDCVGGRGAGRAGGGAAGRPALHCQPAPASNRFFIISVWRAVAVRAVSACASSTADHQPGLAWLPRAFLPAGLELGQGETEGELPLCIFFFNKLYLKASCL